MDKEIEKKLFEEIDIIKDSMNDIKVCIAQLPCQVHDERFKNVDKNLKRVWGAIYFILTGLTTLATGLTIAFLAKG